MTRIVFLVTHLSGTGHFVRTLAIARAAAAAGATVTLLSGGRPLPHIPVADIEVVQLPWLEVRNRRFDRMLDETGGPASPAYLTARRAAIAAAIGARMPHVLVTETFPLGRRRLAEEFDAAIAAARAARAHVRVVASVRDIPEPPSKPARLEAAAARLAADFDLVLVHGDVSFLPLSASWPLPADLPCPIVHAGYVGAPVPPTSRHGEVLVGVGGGDLGRTLLETAAAASALSAHPWRLRTGGRDAEALARALMARHEHHRLVIEPPWPDWRARLAGAAAAVTLAGYNTVTDLLACDTPVLLVPDETAGEREQAIRAEALAQQDGFLCRRGPLDPAVLATHVDGLAAGPRRTPIGLSIDGAARAARALLTLAQPGIPV